MNGESQITSSLDPIYASLNSRAMTPAAHALVEGLCSGIEYHEKVTGSRSYRRGGKKLHEFKSAIAAFVADLLRAAGDQDAQAWCFRSMKAETFSGALVSFRAFQRLVDALVEVQYVEHAKGAPKWMRNPFDEHTPLNAGGTASRFRATQPLLNLSRLQGIDPQSVDEHFRIELPRHPLILRTASTRGRRGEKIEGRCMPFEPTPTSLRLEEELHRLNCFLDGFTLQGGTHHGYIRLFNLGDLEDFSWDKGGRLYSQGGRSYQSLKEHERVRMIIDGEPVCEIDIKASYLSVLHGLLRLPFDPGQDPYELEALKPLWVDGKDVRRRVVKSWTVATLGHHRHHTRWPGTIVKDFDKATGGQVLGEEYPIKLVRQAMEEKHPVMKDWGTLGISWADLMFVESEAVIRTMIEMMDQHKAPSFSVHDSLIVKERDLELAGNLISHHYHEVCGLKPCLEVNHKDGTSSIYQIGQHQIAIKKLKAA